MTFDTDLEKYYVDMYKKLHVDNKYSHLPFGYGDGKTVFDRMKTIKSLCDQYEVSSILDYGCGKAAHHIHKKCYDKIGIFNIGLYDPGVERFSQMPEGTFDMVICADVCEHIPEQNVTGFLQSINSKAGKCVFFTVSCNKAKDILPNGENAHVTQKNAEWWMDKIMEVAKPDVQYYGMFSEDKEKYFHINSRTRLVIHV